jgi:hypothetical protein
MLKAFLIAVIFCETIELATVASLLPYPYSGQPNRRGESHQQASGNKERAPTALKITCDPDCRYQSANEDGYEYWRKLSSDPIAQFTGVLVVATLILGLVGWRTLIHFRMSERAYISGGGVGAGLQTVNIPITFTRGRFLITHTQRVLGGKVEVHGNNYGKTPGELLEVGIGFLDATLPIPSTPKYTWEPFNAWLRPGEHGLPIMHWPIPAGLASPAVYGRFRFKDVYGDERSAGFILEITHMTTSSLSAPSAYTESD